MFSSAVADENVNRYRQEEAVLEIFRNFVNKYALKIQPRKYYRGQSVVDKDFWIAEK